MTPRDQAVMVCTPYCPGSIGEQVVQIPFLYFLREAHPDVEVVAVVPERSGAVLDRLGAVDRQVGYPVKAGLLELSRIARPLRATRCNEVFQLRRKSWRSALLARLVTGAQVRGFAHGVNRLAQATSIPWDHEVYIAENYTRLLGRSVTEFAAASSSKREDYVLIIPGGLTSMKRYPLEQYETVARELGEERPVHFLLGPDAESERAHLSSAGSGFTVHFAPPMDEVQNLVRGAALVIANDCGPGHFAQIYDAPRVSVFDHSVEPAPWFFAGRNGRLLRSTAPGKIAEIAPIGIVEQGRELLSGVVSS